MLLAFEVEGYKLFDDRVQFTMHANMRFKKLKENKTSIMTELIAGLTTFMAISYIIFITTVQIFQ